MFISSDIPYPRFTDSRGRRIDLGLLLEDRWLMDTEVKYHLKEKNSLWHLTMIYVAVDNPLKFICRKIDTYHSEKKGRHFCQITSERHPKRCQRDFKNESKCFQYLQQLNFTNNCIRS